MKAILLCWLAMQQQTRTFKRQKFSQFYVKFSAEFNQRRLISQSNKR